MLEGIRRGHRVWSLHGSGEVMYFGSAGKVFPVPQGRVHRRMNLDQDREQRSGRVRSSQCW